MAKITKSILSVELLEKAFQIFSMAKAMTEYYEAHFKFVSKYVHATSRGHEAIQIAVGLQLLKRIICLLIIETIACFYLLD